MKKWRKKLKRRLESISRGNQTVFYLTWSVLLSFGIWMRLGCPLPTMELEFRRMERTRLLPRSEIVFNSGKDCPLRWRELPELDFRYDDVVVGMTKNQVYVYIPDHNGLEICSLENGIISVPMYDVSAVWRYHGNLKTGTPLLFLNVPEETERAEVEVWLDGEQRAGNGWGLKMGCGWCVWAWIRPPGHLNGPRMASIPSASTGRTAPCWRSRAGRCRRNKGPFGGRCPVF